MFLGDTNYLNVKWPVRVMDGLKSQDKKAKLAATMLHDNMDTIRNEVRKTAEQEQGYDKYGMVYLCANKADNKAGKFVQNCITLRLHLANPRKFNYTSNDNFSQDSYGGKYGDYNYNKLSSNDKLHQVLEQESKNDYKSLTQIIPDHNNIRQDIPYPALLNNNGNVKTIYKYNNNNTFRNLEEQELHDEIAGQNVNPSDISDQLMADFVEQIDENSPLKQRDFKEQYNYIKYFEKHKNEVFDNPVSLATEAYSAYLELQEDTFIIDSEVGERMEVQKQGDVFNIDFYNKDNKLSMQGEFTILKDAQGVPLKEDEDGKILDQNDANYNTQDKLCFDMKFTTYHEDTETRALDFERNINLDDREHEKNISFSCYDKEGEIIRNEEISLPYALNKLKARFSKVFYNIYKSDLKDLNEELTSKRLHPDDIQFNLEQIKISIK